MKTLFKKYWWIALVLIVAIILMVQRATINNLRSENSLKDVELSTFKDSVKQVVSRNGKLTAKIEAVQVESNDRKKALELAGFNLKDYKDREINWRKTELALKAQLEAANHGTMDLRDTVWLPAVSSGGDSIHGLTSEWNDRFLFLKPVIVNKKMDFDYTYKTGINFNVSKEGKSSIVSVFLTDPSNKNLPNPYGKIMTGNSITIIQNKHWYQKPWVWGIAGFVGGYFTTK